MTPAEKPKLEAKNLALFASFVNANNPPMPEANPANKVSNKAKIMFTFLFGGERGI